MSPLVLALYYIYDWLRRMPEQPPLERRFHVATTAAWCGAIALAALLRFELNLDWVAAAWAVCALVLLIIAWRSGRELFLHQALFFAIGATFRGALHNLYERSYLPGPFWLASKPWVSASFSHALGMSHLRYKKCALASALKMCLGISSESA